MREMQWRLLLWCLLLVPLFARGDVPPPPPEFWDYLADFGDQDGDVFDPLDLTEAQQVVRSQTASTEMKQDVNTPSQEESQP